MDLQEDEDIHTEQGDPAQDSAKMAFDFDSQDIQTESPNIATEPPSSGQSPAIVVDPVAVPPPLVTQPPPDVPLALWVETKTDAGKSYFYHSVTRETTWTKPEGPGVKIVTQSELELMNVKKQQMLPVMDNRIGDPVVRRTDTKPPVLLNHPFAAPPPRFALPPPLGMPPPAWIMLPPQVPPQGNPLPDPSLVARANEWTEHRAPDGRTFYYNASKSESVWEKPEAIRELEAARLAAVQSQVMNTAPPLMPHPMHHHHHPHPHHHPPMLPGHQLGVGGPMPVMPPTNIHEVLVAEMRQMEERKKQEDRAKAQQAAVQAAAVAAAAAATKPVDKSKPISSTPISGTPWCVVWTGDGRVFFYNPSTKTSLWERPEELAERADVTKAMSTVPEQLLASNPGNCVPAIRSTQNVTVAPVAAVTQATVTSPIAHVNREKEEEKSEQEYDDEQDEQVPMKKLKVNDAPAEAVPVEEKSNSTAMVSANEAEMQASRERAQVPLEQRVAMFKEMLREKDVSAFSTWEKELHKIVFDQRYLLLTSRERKQIFEKYVKDRAEEERKEKRTKMRQKITEFRELMESAGLHGKTTFSEFAQKYAKDERLRAIEKMRERESLFNEFIIEVRKREKEEAANKKEQARKDFIQMLKDHPHVDRHCRWSEVKKLVDGKSAYRAVDGSDVREELFNEYCKLMKEEKRRAKDKDGGTRDKEKERDRGREKESERRRSGAEKERKRSSDDSSHDDEDDYEEQQQQRQRERERQMRAEASIKEREKEVQRTLAGHLRERDNKREHHKKGEAIAHFNALLTDLVRNSDLTWKEVKRQLRKDHRFPLVDTLERDEKERLFNEHVHALTKKKRDKFRQMLDEISHLELTSSWKEVKRQVKDDPRYMKYNSSEMCEREFREYIKDKTIESKNAFRELLIECKLINHKTLEVLHDNPGHMHEIEEILKNDKRFLVLEHVAIERNQMIYNHLEELHKRGPPPPPTAATATRRKP